MFQMKEQHPPQRKIFNEMEISNFPDEEFKVIVIRMFIKDAHLGRRIEDHSENFNKVLKKNQTEMKNTITEMKKYTRGNQHQIS